MWLLKYNATILRHDSNQLCELNFDNLIDEDPLAMPNLEDTRERDEETAELIRKIKSNVAEKWNFCHDTATISIIEGSARECQKTPVKLSRLTLGVSEPLVSWFTCMGFLLKG